MADLGPIGTSVSAPIVGTNGSAGGFMCAVDNLVQLWSGGGRDNTQGSPFAPSLKHANYGINSFLWPVDVGTRNLSVDCKHNYASGVPDRPYIRIFANPEVGLQNDVIARATDSAIWNTVSSGAITINAVGTLKVALVSPYTGPGTQVNWDNIVPS